MSAIAHVLMEKGYRVSGSDLRCTEITRALQEKGLPVFKEHNPANLDGVEAVVYSSAIPSNNPELVEARRRGLPLKHRSDMLACLLNDSTGIAVAGAHGKTTTTSMLGIILAESGLDPTVLIGALSDDLTGNAVAGKGPYVVAEACESDHSFLKYSPFAAIVTNIEPDHLENYDGDFNNLVQAYRQFLQNTKKEGFCMVYGDDPVLQSLKESVNPRVLTYGFSAGNMYRPQNIELYPGGSKFDLYYNGDKIARVTLSVPGEHNILNATAALSACHHMGLNINKLAQNLERFNGARRRFQVIGSSNNITVVDDYAHHPTEIITTLKTARLQNKKRNVVFFQPKRYTRTRFLFDEFTGAFTDADVLVMSEIFGFGESPIPGITTEALSESIEKNTGKKVTVVPYDHEAIIEKLLDILEPGDLAVTLGAGDDIAELAQKLYRTMEKACQLYHQA